MNGISIKSVTPQRWSPGFTPQSVNLHGGWAPAPLPMGPEERVPGKMAETLGIAMAVDPDAALGQAGAKAVAATTVALITLPAVLTAYVGFRLGTKDKGLPSILGYVVGTVASLGVLAGLLALVGVVALPMPSGATSGPMVGPATPSAPALPSPTAGPMSAMV